MAKCENCGAQLRYHSEIVAGNLCVNCGPGSARQQMKEGSSVSEQVTQEVSPDLAEQMRDHNERVAEATRTVRRRVARPDPIIAEDVAWASLEARVRTLESRVADLEKDRDDVVTTELMKAAEGRSKEKAG